MRLKDYINEMAAVPAEYRSKVFYHGASTLATAGLNDILKNGIKAPEITNNRKMTPIRGRVYITDSLETAVIYALGGVMMGNEMHNGPTEKKYPYGYLFVIDTKTLTDIIPDEDEVGELVYKKNPEWLYNKAQMILTDKQFRAVMSGEYADWASNGKKILKNLSVEQVLKLLPFCKNVSNEGTLKIKQAWKIDKTLSIKLMKDGSNFFKIAERIK